MLEFVLKSEKSVYLGPQWPLSKYFQVNYFVYNFLNYLRLKFPGLFSKKNNVQQYLNIERFLTNEKLKQNCPRRTFWGLFFKTHTAILLLHSNQLFINLMSTNNFIQIKVAREAKDYGKLEQHNFFILNKNHYKDTL